MTIIAWGKAYFSTIISILALLGFLLFFPILTQWSGSPMNILWFSLDIDRVLGYISILIGLASVCLALWSIQSTTISLKDIQSDYWNVRGLDQKKQENYFDAFQAFDKSMRIDPAAIKCLINKANALSEKGKKHHDKIALIESIRVIRQAIDKGIKCPLTWKKGTPDEAKAKQEYANALKTECDALIALAESSNGFAYNEELFFEALKASEKAIQKYENVIQECSWQTSKFSSELPGAYASKATSLSHLGRHDEAIKICEEAIEQGLYEPLAWAIKGNTLNNKGIFLKSKEEYAQAANAYSSAVVAYDQAIKLMPSKAVFWHNKGTALLNEAKVLLKTIENPSKISTEQYDKSYKEALDCFNAAIHAYDKAVEFDPLDFETWMSKGDALLGQKLNDKAIESYDMAIDINPLNLSAKDKRNQAINDQINQIATESNKGIEDLKQSLYGDAVRSFDKVIKQNPRYKTAFYNMGYALHQLGKYNEALDAYYNAIELDSNYALAWNGKGHALKALGRIEESNAAFAQAKRIEEV